MKNAAFKDNLLAKPYEQRIAYFLICMIIMRSTISLLS